MSQEQRDGAQGREYLRPIRDRWWLILLLVTAVTGATYLYYRAQPSEYEATSTVLLRISDVDQALFGSGVFPSDDRNTENQALLIETEPVARRAARAIDFDGDASALLGKVDAVPASGSDFIIVTATDGTASGAARLSNAFVDAFITIQSARSRRHVQKAIESLEGQLAGLPTGPGSQDERAAISAQLEQLKGLEELPAASAQQVEAATPPSEPSAPKPLRNAAFAFALSLMAALVLALLLDRLDRRLHDSDEIEDAFGYPLLAHVPKNPKNGDLLLASRFNEAFRGLRANLQLTSLDRPHRTLLVVSAMPGEGKTTVVQNLAVAYGEAGHRVAAIDADLRRSSLAEFFGVEPGPGLTGVLTGSAELRDALRPSTKARSALATTAAPGPGGSRTGAVNGSGVVVLPSGAAPPNPPAVLATERTEGLIQEVADEHDFVLIDSPALTAVSDALPLLSIVDAVVVVARIQHTTRDAAARLVKLLGQAPHTTVAGIVVNDVAGPRGRGYGYHEYYEQYAPSARSG